MTCLAPFSLLYECFEVHKSSRSYLYRTLHSLVKNALMSQRRVKSKLLQQSVMKYVEMSATYRENSVEAHTQIFQDINGKNYEKEIYAVY